MTIADIGAGSGYFLMPAARIVGLGAPAYGVDASREMLNLLAKKKLPANVKLVHTRDGYTFDIESGAVDYVIASAIIHENDPVRFLKEVRRIMKPGGTLLIIDWRKDALREGPPMHERLTPGEVRAFCSRSHLRSSRALILNSRYYAVVAKRA